MPRQTSLRKISLRTKLVAAVLTLVFAALAMISATSTYALNRFMLDRMDAQLKSFGTQTVNAFNEGPGGRIFLPPDYYVARTSVSGIGIPKYDDTQLTPEDLPPLFTGAEEINEHLGEPYTVRSQNGEYVWRMVVARLNNGEVLHIAQMMIGVDAVIARLIWVDFLVGVGVLIALATVGAAMVRQSLIPLVQIERTAARIAAGDLSQRVPDPEVDGAEPTTELGRLSVALNAMLTQIESAFIARAQSEQAARAAEHSARQAAEAAQRSESRALQSEEKMRQFVADASHELRTPLTTIRGFAELYRQGAVSDPEAVARLVRRIEDEAARMGLLVEDLLLLARLDRERPLTLAPVELPVLALDAVQAAQATAPDREINLEIRDEPERLVAYGDDARLRQVIGNLMTNAVVHTPPGAAVTLRLHAGAGDTAVIEVSDTGPGLSPEQRERVFERFYRADGARTRKTDREATGTGLGLAIVAAIVAAHQGTVEVVSEPDQGATFRVSLPTINADKGFTENVQD
ncbi:PAS domain-containing sensor histidine kinase [Actinoplanes sp. NBC_00393]|uniref:PAS domain-containing sensor histidine kinase n=1 Tax=Actinoplanes sp. NBC_00393 TaxID=2975953 RepID=UPI002E21DE25